METNPDQLDSQISSIRAGISNLQRRKRFLTASLLASAPIQKRLRVSATTTAAPGERSAFVSAVTAATSQEQERAGRSEDVAADADVSPLIQAAGRHAELNYHRIAFSVTMFPFRDPSPDLAWSYRSASHADDDDRSDDGDEGTQNQRNNLLGVRIDVCTRNGRFTKPYYLLLKKERLPGTRERDGYQTRQLSTATATTNREGSESKVQNEYFLRVYRHTIPAFISIQELESVYLPRPPSALTASEAQEEEDEEQQQEEGEGEAYDTDAGAGNPSEKARKYPKQDLYALLRQVRKKLVACHLRMDAVDYLREQLGLVRRDGHSSPSPSEGNAHGVVSLSPTSLDARYVRIEWRDGRVGRLKITDTGVVERAVVIGDGGRDKAVEYLMTRGDGRIETILERLRPVDPQPAVIS